MPDNKSTRQPDGQPPKQSCPICGKAAVPRWRPFCSRRCADVDLGRWLGEGYAIPGEPAEPPPGSGSGDED